MASHTPMYVTAYIDAFSRCYPQTKIRVTNRWDRVAQVMQHRVHIDGDAGDLTLSEETMRSATRDLQRGRIR